MPLDHVYNFPTNAFPLYNLKINSIEIFVAAHAWCLRICEFFEIIYCHMKHFYKIPLNNIKVLIWFYEKKKNVRGVDKNNIFFSSGFITSILPVAKSDCNG